MSDPTEVTDPDVLARFHKWQQSNPNVMPTKGQITSAPLSPTEGHVLDQPKSAPHPSQPGGVAGLVFVIWIVVLIVRRIKRSWNNWMQQGARQAEAQKRVRTEQQAKEHERIREETRRQEQARARQREQTRPQKPLWWDILGVAPSATLEDIQRAYRQKLKQYHPDRLATLAPELIQLAELRTKELNQAFIEAKRQRA